MQRLSSYESGEIAGFLSLINLSEYENCLLQVSLEELSNITDDKLKELGVPVRLHRIKILESLKYLEISTHTQHDTETDITDYNSQSSFDYFDISDQSTECFTFKAISGYLEGVTFLIGEKGVKIGRGSIMDIVIPDSFVSRKHCEIEYVRKSNEFLIFDTGSTTGTYIMVRDEFPLNIGSLFQIGQSEFKVLNIYYSLFGNPISLELLKYEGPNPMPLIITKGGIIGRANNCDISVPFDSLMSLIHCKIFVKEGSFYIKDINSKIST